MAATSVDGMALEKLQKMFSLSPTFITEAGGSPLTRIHFGSVANLADQAAFPRPLVILEIDDRIDRFVAGGDQNFLRAGGKLGFSIIRNASANPDSSAEYLAQLDWMSAVVSEVAALAAEDDAGGSESHLNIVRIDMDAFGQCDESLWTTLGQFYGLESTVYWGDDDLGRR